MCQKKIAQLQLIPLAAALLLAFGSASAQTIDEEQALMAPRSWVSAGVGGVDSEADAVRFGQYNGLNQSAAALLDFELNKRDDASGSWTRFTGRNLGLDTRELGLSREKQGDWKIVVDYNEIVRNDPYGITTSGVPAGDDVSLKLQRKAFGLSAEKWMTPELQLQLSLRNEDKSGERLLGEAYSATGAPQQRIRRQGNAGASGDTAGGWALYLEAQPVDTAIRTMAANMNFQRGDLALSGGYYGSFFVNDDESRRGISPDNQAHQLHLSGNYAFSPATRVNFKLAQTHATQNDDVESLDGVVNTTLAQLGLTTRPTQQLTVNANLRYEDRDDKSTIYASGEGDGKTYWMSGSQTRTNARLDGSYRLPAGYTVTMGLDWERKLTPVPPVTTAVGSNPLFFRPELDETGWHGSVRKVMSETLNGSLGFEYKRRRGDDNAWVPLVAVDTLPADVVLPTLYMDRDRAQWRASLDWTPTEALSLDLMVEHGQDDYERGLPDPSQLVKNDALTLEAAYTVSEDWRVNSYWTQARNQWRVSTDTPGDDTETTARTLGFGVKGKLAPRASFGADLLFVRDVTTSAELADVTNQTDELRLYGSYQIDRQSSVQVTLVHQRFATDDWAWRYNGVPFVYANGASVSMDTNPTVTYVGLAYTYRFR